MLSLSQQKFLDNNFKIYEHEWRIHSLAYGEPFLIDDLVIYYDGLFVNIPAFSLKDVNKEFKKTDIEKAVNSLSKINKTSGIYLWGRVSKFANILIKGQKLSFVKCNDYEEGAGERVINIKKFNFTANHRLKKTVKEIERSGQTITCRQLKKLTSEHKTIIEHWHSTHDIKPYHTFWAHIDDYVKEPGVLVVETMYKGKLLGFAVTRKVNTKTAVAVQTFLKRHKGIPVGDALMYGQIRWAIQEKLDKLHMGYSATPSLLKFKEKWQATIQLPPDREMWFASSPKIAERITQGSFLKEHRELDPID